MSSQLPPSRFGAGYTYGGPPEAQPQPQPPPPPSAYQSNPYDTTQVAPPAMTYPATGQYSDPYPQQAPLPAATGAGGAAVTGGLLACLAGLAHIGWPIKFLYQLNQHSLLFKVTDLFNHGFKPWMIGSSIAQIVFGALLLIGGILLMSRRASGRSVVGISAIVLLVVNVVSVVLGYVNIPAAAKYILGNKLMFWWNGVFWWWDAESTTQDVKDVFTIQCVAWGALMFVTLLAMIMAFASSAARTRAITPSPYTTY